MSRSLGGLSRRLREAGFRGRLLMLTSQGGVMDAEDLTQAPIHAVGSGPPLGPPAGEGGGRGAPARAPPPGPRARPPPGPPRRPAFPPASTSGPTRPSS